MDTVQTAPWPYRTYRFIRGPLSVIATLGALAMIGMAYFFFLVGLLLEGVQSRNGFAATYLVACVPVFIVMLFAIGNTWAEGGSIFESFIILPVFFVLMHWIVLGVYFLLVGAHYPAPVGTVSVDRTGSIYFAGEEVPRSWFVQSAQPLDLEKHHIIDKERSVIDPEAKTEALMRYTVRMTVVYDREKLGAEASRLVKSGVPFSEIDDRLGIDDTRASLEQWVIKRPVQEFRERNDLRQERYPWIGSITITEVTREAT